MVQWALASTRAHCRLSRQRNRNVCLRSTADRRVVDDDHGHQMKLVVPVVVAVVVVVVMDDELAISIESSLESSNQKGA